MGKILQLQHGLPRSLWLTEVDMGGLRKYPLTQCFVGFQTFGYLQ
ncbi:hypothetical protein DDI_2945 [Dickeya dianthicola RNS04.9]|nr:hypothetical protein DDI_2945 [Dickeya dianthicola RNS04.9]